MSTRSVSTRSRAARPAPGPAAPVRAARRRAGACCCSARSVAAAVAVPALIAPFADRAVQEVTLPLRHDDIIRQQAEDKGLDPALIAGVIYAESRFRDQTSHAGAKGLMQIMPATADYIARKSGGTAFEQGDLGTPQINIAYGSWYLRYLLDRYDGNVVLALAAYNAGEGKVDELAGRRAGAPASASASRSHIPFPETRDYVDTGARRARALPARVPRRARACEGGGPLAGRGRRSSRASAARVGIGFAVVRAPAGARRGRRRPGLRSARRAATRCPRTPAASPASPPSSAPPRTWSRTSPIPPRRRPAWRPPRRRSATSTSSSPTTRPPATRTSSSSPPGAIDATLAVNVRATLLLVQAYAARHDDARPGGRVVLLTSGQNLEPMPRELPYAASKGALTAITPSLAAHLAPRGILVNAVNPGPTDTGWATPELTRHEMRRLPLGRWGAPDDAARADRLARERTTPAWITGQVLTSDGGFSLSRG